MSYYTKSDANIFDKIRRKLNQSDIVQMDMMKKITATSSPYEEFSISTTNMIETHYTGNRVGFLDHHFPQSVSLWYGNNIYDI